MRTFDHEAHGTLGDSVACDVDQWDDVEEVPPIPDPGEGNKKVGWMVQPRAGNLPRIDRTSGSLVPALSLALGRCRRADSWFSLRIFNLNTVVLLVITND